MPNAKRRHESRTAYWAAIAADRNSPEARAAFAQLVRLWHPRWLAFARSRAPDLADDVVQDAALSMAMHIHRLRDPSTFGAWSMSIVARRGADTVRKTVRRRQMDRDALPDRPVSVQPTIRPESMDLKTGLLALSSSDRDLLRAYYYEGLNGPELSRRLRVPIGTIKSRLHAARARLRRQLETHPPDGQSPEGQSPEGQSPEGESHERL